MQTQEVLDPINIATEPEIYNYVVDILRQHESIIFELMYKMHHHYADLIHLASYEIEDCQTNLTGRSKLEMITAQNDFYYKELRLNPPEDQFQHDMLYGKILMLGFLIATEPDLVTVTKYNKFLLDIVWWNRATLLRVKRYGYYDDPKIPGYDLIMRIEEYIHEDYLYYRDFDWAVLNGLFSTVRWALDYEWDMLDS